ncbi:MAG: hypothetical protein NC344_04020 [Bacteroidales bacterium]|nr:hypothetical protein [Bacteroidales bacterium]MCM1146995.1 hypothetical protein [Bacteroidales bacterium]MCM1205872.1 hypothetical protein [Bacillota bacterium]MCM1509887.1 hypothetical protein [Clostridium sp.]
MKKFTFLCCAALSLAFASCTTVVKTASTADARASLLSATVADLEVSPERVTVTTNPSKAIQRAGISNVKHDAERKALSQSGKEYDVLVDAEYVIEKTNYVFYKKIKSVTVSGRPAKYKNFHSLNDSVWCNPVFRAAYTNAVTKDRGGLRLFK